MFVDEGLVAGESHKRERINESIRLTNVLSDLVCKVRVFSTDSDDEFQITREDGISEGIFKTWAVPVIPFLERGKESDLADSLYSNTGGFWERLPEDLVGISEDWANLNAAHPTRLWQTLERWRGFSEVFDRRLHEIFLSRELPNSTPERIAELYWRLKIAFGYAAPFYHIEAMIASQEDSFHNPIKANGDLEGGELDVVGMLLPSALSSVVISDTLDWKGLNWEEIQRLKENLNSEEKVLVHRIARTAQVSTEDIIFAANALQWIPASVGGKKDDVEKEEAIKTILNLLDPAIHLATQSAIARDVNALIRFLNWMPLIRNQENFSSAGGWRYASVCDTTSLLLEELKKQGAVRKDFEDVFQGILVPQLGWIDAASAKGRFILGLVDEGRLSKDVENAILLAKDPIINSISKSLVISDRKAIPIGKNAPRSQIGGKAFGLWEAISVFGEDKVVDGVTIPCEVIDTWLRQDKELWELINGLEILEDVGEKILMGPIIQDKIFSLDIPPDFIKDLTEVFSGKNLLSVRSSSFDEDTLNSGTAAGIYESVLRVSHLGIETAIKTVMASFFDGKAISYRNLHSLSDVPMLAVLVQEFIEGPGGVAFSKSDMDGWELVVGASPSSIVSGGEKGSYETFSSDRSPNGVVSRWVTNNHIVEMGELISQAEEFFGTPVDIEFVVDGNEKLMILQLRPLHFTKNPVYEKQLGKMRDVNVGKLGDLESVSSNGDILRLVLGDFNTDQFLGDLFRWLVINSNDIGEIVLPVPIARTSHFANICINLGIRLTFKDDSEKS